MNRTAPPETIQTWNLCNGTLALCDCLDWMERLPGGSIQLVAIDPPFFTGRTQVGGGEEPSSYQDTWRGSKEEYLNWLLPRISAMRDLLTPTGSFLVHLDWHAVHAVKVALDDLFGEECFQNEIIWYYQTGGATRRRFSRKHDTLLWYTRTAEWTFHPERIRVRRSPKALHRAKNPKGARIRVTDTHKYPEDVLFIPQLNPMSKERTGYPTQKPLELMEVFVQGLTDPGECVADFFCGSGTTPAAAALLGRRWLACDKSPEAARVTRERILNLAACDKKPKQGTLW
jgi:DNA modification methylase